MLNPLTPLLFMTTSLCIDPAELLRLQQMMIFEEEAYRKGYTIVGGIDEAGRGPLAGPVVAAVCVLPKNLLIPHLNDSKKLTPKKRREIFERLLADETIHYGIGYATPEEIDAINIYQATIQAMKRAVDQLSVIPDCLLVDGLSLPHMTIPCVKIIRGDQLSQSIAAASVIAKETRDQLMLSAHEQWPGYGFNQHKGYGTPQHLAALKILGPCSIHRRTFEPIKTEWSLTTQEIYA
jgi:ribonuclease HII